MLKTRVIAIATLLALAPFLAGQSLVVVPATPVQEKREALARAFEAWSRSDTNLERDFLGQPSEQALRRIAQAEERAARLVSARDAYYQTVMDEIRRQITTLREPSPSAAAARELRSGVEEKAARLLKTEKELEALTRTRAETAAEMLEREEREKQRQRVAALRENAAEQVRSLQSAEDSTGKIESARRALLQDYEQLLQLFKTEATAAKSEAPLLRDYYQALRAMVAEAAAERPDVRTAPRAGSQARKPGGKAGGKAGGKE